MTDEQVDLLMSKVFIVSVPYDGIDRGGDLLDDMKDFLICGYNPNEHFCVRVLFGDNHTNITNHWKWNAFTMGALRDEFELGSEFEDKVREMAPISMNQLDDLGYLIRAQEGKWWQVGAKITPLTDEQHPLKEFLA